MMAVQEFVPGDLVFFLGYDDPEPGRFDLIQAGCPMTITRVDAEGVYHALPLGEGDVPLVGHDGELVFKEELAPRRVNLGNEYWYRSETPSR